MSPTRAPRHEDSSAFATPPTCEPPGRLLEQRWIPTGSDCLLNSRNDHVPQDPGDRTSESIFMVLNASKVLFIFFNYIIVSRASENSGRPGSSYSWGTAGCAPPLCSELEAALGRVVHSNHMPLCILEGFYGTRSLFYFIKK